MIDGGNSRNGGFKIDTEKEVQELRQRVEELEAGGNRRGRSNFARFMIGCAVGAALIILLLVGIGIIQFISG